ncbi:MAG: hypothetical protein ACXWDI_12395 [Nocardioides sp.]
MFCDLEARDADHATVLAIGEDGGHTWVTFDETGYDSVVCTAADGECWASGSQGRRDVVDVSPRDARSGQGAAESPLDLGAAKAVGC